MRQVNRDELTYLIFGSLRSWSRGLIGKLFDPPRTWMRDRIAVERRLACGPIADRLRYVIFLSPDRYASPIGREERISTLATAFDVFPGAIGKLWLADAEPRRDDARRAAANLFADALDGFELLAETKLDWLTDGIDRVMFPEVIAPAHAMRSSWP